uniref:AAA family ATPase n=1 Tax=Microbacterium maritypicum TaxID=33918 RepID=UPI0022E5AF14
TLGKFAERHHRHELASAAERTFVPSGTIRQAASTKRPENARYGHIMLRRIDLNEPWRSLGKSFWPEDLPLGPRTVVYGHNGSGKSTLSELLLGIAEGQNAANVVWENENRQRINVKVGEASPSMSVAVFTRRWVESNLSAFLDGASASAIVTLGKEAIDAREEEERLVAEIGDLREAAKEASKQHKTTASKIDKLTREVQERIVSELKVFDYSHFTKNRYSVPKVQDELRAYKGEHPDSESHAEALKRLGEGAPTPVRPIDSPPLAVAGDLARLPELLAETPTRVAIRDLEGRGVIQSWVEQGIQLHDTLERCLYCAGPIDEGSDAGTGDI